MPNLRLKVWLKLCLRYPGSWRMTRSKLLQQTKAKEKAEAMETPMVQSGPTHGLIPSPGPDSLHRSLLGRTTRTNTSTCYCHFPSQ